MKTKLIGVCGRDLFMTDGDLAFKAGKEYEFIDSERARGNEFNTGHGLGKWKTEFTFKWVNEFEEGDYLITKMGSIFIYKARTGMTIWDYAYLGFAGMKNFGTSPACHSSEVIGLATPEQIGKMDKALASEGKRWDAKLKRIVDLEYVPKEGDFVTLEYMSRYKALICFRRFGRDGCIESAFDKTENGHFYNCPNVYFKGSLVKTRPSTEKEKKELLSLLEKSGKRWDAEKKKVVDLEWKPKEGDVVVNGNGSIYIYKTGCNSVVDNFYASFYEGSFYTSGLARRNNTRLATYEERCKFFERLVKEGYKWDSRKLKLTKVGLRPEDMKRGEFYKIITDSGNEWVVLFDKISMNKILVLSDYACNTANIYFDGTLCKVSAIAKITPASESDIEAIKKAAESFGYFFNGKAFEKGFDSWVKHVKGSYSERFLSDKVKQLNAILNERD